jgi:DNA transformation protein
MFGGYGLYASGLFFAVIWDNRLYLKAAAADEAAFRARGMGPFTYEGGALKSIWEVPADVLEDAEQLGEWARRAVAAARSAKLAKATKSADRPRAPRRRR